MRRGAKIDANQGAIVAALRKSGCRVLSLARIGHGCPDLLAYRAGLLYLIEIKDGNKSPSRIKLTPHQVRFHRDWPVHTVRSVQESLIAVGLQDPVGAE